MKRFQLLTTAIFLFCTLLIAGCTGRGVEAQATPAPEATPTATTDIRSGIQTGDSEVNKILAGTWAFERTDADKKADDSSLSQILPDTDTGEKTATEIKEPGTIRDRSHQFLAVALERVGDEDGDPHRVRLPESGARPGDCQRDRCSGKNRSLPALGHWSVSLFGRGPRRRGRLRALELAQRDLRHTATN